MKKKILQIGAPVLEQEAKQIKKSEIKSPEIQGLIDDMIDTCRANIDNTAGLSAPQIGESKSISICRRFDIGEDVDIWEVMINPTIISNSSETTTFWEGCLSIGTGDKTIYGPVARPKRVKVVYLDREGEKKSLEGEDFFSHVIQHEVDHVNGVLFLKYVPNPYKNLWLSKDLDDYLDQYGEFPSIS